MYLYKYFRGSYLIKEESLSLAFEKLKMLLSAHVDSQLSTVKTHKAIAEMKELNEIEVENMELDTTRLEKMIYLRDTVTENDLQKVSFIHNVAVL